MFIPANDRKTACLTVSLSEISIKFMPFSFLRDSALCLVIISASHHFYNFPRYARRMYVSHRQKKFCRSDHYVLGNLDQTAIYYYNIDHHDLKILFINH